MADESINTFEELSKWLVPERMPTQDKPWWEISYSEDGDVNKLIEFVNALSDQSYLNLCRLHVFFRGQGDASWGLEPSLYRLVKNIPQEEALRIEFDAIRYFKQQARAFLRPQMIPKDEEHGEWLALMQQNRAPTRMLDWTVSCNVALYFAVTDEPMDKPGAIWFFWKHELLQWMSRFKKPSQAEYQAILSNPEKFVQYGKQAQPKIDVYDPDIKSERMTAQQGIYTYCEQLFCDQVHVIGKALLDAYQEKKVAPPLSKIVIGPRVKKEMRKYVNKLNITAATLFPGVEGLGRAISEIITVQRELFYS
jgi:hypothetical protein